jgi:ribosomal protein S18 acetylase RimI-like enzyme
MLEIRVLGGRQVLDAGLEEEIIELDKRNMRAVWERAGMEFPEENRRRGLRSDPTLVIALDGCAVAGYLEYLRSWNDPRYIYIGSLVVDLRYRNTGLVLRLLDVFRSLVAGEDCEGFETSVQKVNTHAVGLYRKLGFRLEQSPRNEASWTAKAGREELLEDSPLIPLLDRWRERQARRGRRTGS